MREWGETDEERPRSSAEIFNYWHSRARIIVECAFGVLKAQWTVLRSIEYTSSARQNAIVHTVCALHNYLLCDDDLETMMAATAVTESDVESSCAEDDDGALANACDVSATLQAAQWRAELAEACWLVYKEHYCDQE